MPHLSADTLGRLPAAIRRFGYDRDAISTGIVHLGIGAFHRAHQAVFVEDCLERGERDWGIFGASLRSAETAEALLPQDNLYTLAVRDAAGERLRVVGALTGLHAARGRMVPDVTADPLFRQMIAPETRIVSLTITEKGYCHLPASGELNEAHPDILHDLAHPGAPRSAIGMLAMALKARRALEIAPFTLVSCDNLPANGRTLKRVIDRFASLLDGEFGRWAADNVICPASMVDRIVPATTDDDRARISAALGFADRWPVVTEPFRQWVMEDHFPTGRPDLAASGVELVKAVEPFEHMKLRLLNGSHSTLAYLGYLAGYETIAEAIGDGDFARLVRGLMDEEVTPTLHMPSGTDLAGYKASLIARFANPALRHRTWQIAMDGSQKLPQRLLGTIRDRLASGAPIHRLALGVAGWMRYVAGIDEKGQPIDVRDQMAERLKATAEAAGPVAARLAPALMNIREIFGEDLPADPRFAEPVTAALHGLFREGSRAMVAGAGRD